MSRSTSVMGCKLLIALLLVASVSSSPVSLNNPSAPVSLEGVNLPTTLELAPTTRLIRNGFGLRALTLMGWHMKMYVASVYSSRPLRSEREVLQYYPYRADKDDNASTDEEPPVIQFDFTFLRDVPKNRVIMAWQRQVDYSVSYNGYDDYQRDRDALVDALSMPIRNGDTQSVQFLDRHTTRLLHAGVETGRIHGHEFQRAFCSMWFGDNAVQDDIKRGLLQGYEEAAGDEPRRAVPQEYADLSAEAVAA